MMLKGSVAMDKNRVIGKDGKMPWHEPEDLRRFKQLTQGQICLMGRKTYEGLKQYRPNSEGYPHASKNLVFSKSMPDTPGIEVIHSVDELRQKYGNEVVWVLGGAKTFEVLMPYINELYVTLIPGKHEGDAHMPELNPCEYYRETLEETKSGLKFEKYTKITEPEALRIMSQYKHPSNQ